MSELTLGSLFDGSGGFPLAGLLAGIRPVFSSEIEPFPIRVTTKRMPFVKHYGDVSRMDGGKIEPVDIITFGSPCQDMSVAGKRGGLDGERSGLFYEAVRIIKEMRCATDGRYPRYAVWENVPGAFSSNGGEDFRAVLEALCQICGEDIHVPRPERWPNAGEIVADGFSLAWRVLDSRFWGVPQRRKRIYLVADFAGGSAGKILFESEGLSGYSAEGFRAWQRAAGSAAGGIGNAGGDGVLAFHINQRDETIDLHGVSGALMATRNMQMQTFVAALENHPADSRITVSEDGKVQTLTSRMGTGGNNVPLIMDTPKTLKIRSGCEGGGKGALVQEDRSATLSCNNDQTLFVPKTYSIGAYSSEGMRSDNPNAGIYEADTSRTLDCSGGTPAANQGGIAVVENHAVYSSSKASFFTDAEKDRANTLVATDYKDPPLINERSGYSVRRLTPTECARLQGFPDWWCDGLGTEKPTDEELYFWYKVFEEYRRVTKPDSKPKSSKQILKWLKDPHSDAAEYKMWGNGVALPCVVFVLSGIVYYSQTSGG